MQSSVSPAELRLYGTPFSPGIALGKAWRVSAIDLDLLISFRQEIPDVEAELRRFREALDRSRQQTRNLYENSASEVSGIFSAQLMMLDDTFMQEQLLGEIRLTRINSEHIVARRALDIRAGFEELEDETFRARSIDIQDIYHRVLGNLLEIDHVRSNPIREAPSGSILVSQRLLPSDVVHMNSENIAGIVTEDGSSCSHTSILARGLQIPYIGRLRGIASIARTNDSLLIDGLEGLVSIHPSPHTVRAFKARTIARQSAVVPFGICQTADGVPVRLLVNASSADEIEAAYSQGADGVGLFRTEFYYLQSNQQPSVESEIAFYAEAFRAGNGKPVAMRLFDFGGDKVPLFAMPGDISRGAFGSRGIRYLLAHPEILRRQVSCLLAAAAGSSFEIIIPFVTSEVECSQAVELIRHTLAANGVDPMTFRVGMMLEIPAAIFLLDRLIHHVDFVSVGTNDLVQYTFASDREDDAGHEIQTEARNLMVELVHRVLLVAAEHNKDLRVCGELAADNTAIPRLLGAGVRSLSIAARSLAQVHRLIATLDTGMESCPGGPQTESAGDAHLSHSH